MNATPSRIPAGLSVVVAVVLLAFVGPAAAQDGAPPPVVVSDRPDLSNGIQIVPMGHLQLEGGVTATRTGGTTELGLGELMARVPLSSRIEARIQFFSYALTSGTDSARGAADPAVDVKWKLFDSEATDFGVIVGTALPLGAKASGEPHLQPYGVFSLDETLTEDVSFTANVGAASESSAGETYRQLFGGLSLAVQVSTKATLFLEGFGWSRTEARGPGEQLVDGGVQYLLTDRLMLDARLGVAFGRTAPDGFAGLGAAFLF